MQHQVRGHDVEAGRFERQVRDVGLGDLHIGELREPVTCGGEHGVVDVGNGQAGLRISARDAGGHRAAASSDFQDLPGERVAVQRPGQDATPSERAPWAAAAERAFDG